MNKLVIAALASAFSLSAWAAEVSPERAMAYAGAYLRNIVGSDLRPVSADAIVFDGTAALYVVSLAPQGWAIIAADDVIAPIVGYSETGSLVADSLDANFRSYLGLFADDVAVRTERGDAASPAWATDTVPHTNKDESLAVGPLINVAWNQSGKYRQYCPSSSSAGEALVGCVAVGMGQAMTVYRKPDRPVGYTSYTSANYGVLSVDYDSEAAYDWSAIIKAQDSDSDGKECARLLYHCGVAVGMDYSKDGSGVTYMGIVPKVLKTHFGYSNKMKNVSKSDYSNDEWVALLKNELNAGRPIIYAGYSSSGGHCFNIDGYSSGGLFNFNFGWGGEGNGTFSISGHEYTNRQMCLINFAPATGAPQAVILSKTSAVKGSAVGTVVATLSTDTDMDDCEFAYEVTGVENALTHKVPDPVFDVQGDKLVTNSLFAEKYPAGSNAKSVSVNITSTNVTTLDSYTQKFNVMLSESNALDDVSAAGLSVACSGGAISVSTSGSAAQVSILSADGKVVGSARVSAFGSARFESLAEGLYVVCASDGVSTVSRKVVVKR